MRVFIILEVHLTFIWTTSLCSYIDTVSRWSQPITYQPIVGRDFVTAVIQLGEFIYAPKLQYIFLFYLFYP